MGLIGISLWESSSLEPNFSLRAFFGQSDPDQEVLNEYREHWGADDAFVLLLVTPDSGSLIQPKRFEALDETRKLLEKNIHVTEVRSPTSIALIEGSTEGELDLSPMIDSMPERMEDSDWASWKANLLTNPFLVPALLARDEQSAALIVEFTGDTDNATEIVKMVDSLRLDLEQRQGVEGLSYIAAGVPAVRRDFFYSFFGDIRFFGTIALVLAIMLLAFIFRSVSGVFVPLLSAGIPVLMVFGVMGFMGESIGILNQAFFTLLPAIAIADAIHLISRFQEESQLPGKGGGVPSHHEAIKRALSHVGWTCFLTTFTTGIGFLSLRVASMPILHNFGTYAALGMLFAYGMVLFIVPVALSFTKPHVKASSRKGPDLGDHWLSKVALFSIRKPKAILAVTVVVVAVLVYWGTQVNLDNRLTSLLKETHPTSQANEQVDASLGGVLTLEFDIRSKDQVEDESEVTAPPVLEAMSLLEAKLNTVEAFRMSTSPATYVRSAHKALMGSDTIPDSRAAIEQLLLLMEGSDSVENMLASDRRRARLIVRLQDVGGQKFTTIVDQAKVWTEDYFQGLPVDVRVTGTPFVAYRGINRITSDLRNSLSLAFAIIAVLIGLLFKDLRIALICLVPNALPLIAGYGLMGAMGWLLQPSSALVFTVALGIAVDDTIHMMARYREALDKGMDNNSAVHEAVLRCGRAVAITSLVLCVGFGVNALSAFQQMTVLGSLGATVIFVALLCDLFVLPALLSLFGQKSEKPVPAA